LLNQLFKLTVLAVDFLMARYNVTWRAWFFHRILGELMLKMYH
jgi:hypothetical protein